MTRFNFGRRWAGPPSKLAGLAALTAVVAAVAFAFAGPSAAVPVGGSLDWNGVNGATACAPDTQGTMLWIFNPHSDAVPTDLTITWNLSGGGTSTQTYTGWAASGGGQNWHLTVDIPVDAVLPPASATLDYTGELGGNPILTISGCNEGTTPTASAPTVVKTAAGSYDDTFSWDIQKDVDKTYVEQMGGSVTFNYTVTVSHDAGTISDVMVSGTITAVNGNAGDLTLNSVTDQLSDSTTCSVDTSGGLVVPGNGTLDFPYSCDLGSTVPVAPITNTATIGWADQSVGGQSLTAGTASFTTDPIDFAASNIDDCVDVTDTIAGDLGTVCVGDPNPTTFTYSNTVQAPPAGNCTTVDNTATFTTNTTGSTGDSSQEVQVCAFNAPLTIGYWGNHLAANGTSGCTHLPNGTGCSKNGPWTKQFLPQPLGNFSVSTFQLAAAVFAANNCSNAASSSQNAVGCLAAQLLAAELNVANVSNPCIDSTIADANAFLVTIGYVGPTGHYTLTTSQRNSALALKDTLVNYNQGGGC